KTQLETSSAVVLICGNLNKVNSAKYIYNKKYINNEITYEQKENFLKTIKNHYNKITYTRLQNEIFFEAGIIALHFILTLQDFDYSCCFIGGFSFEKINNIFGISQDYVPVILLSVGKKAIISNNSETTKKFKFNIDDFVFFL
ncbi:MAG: nitroreductase family protein, partial [Candidatus Phytoplasma stylosanthis]|nr:nitroreductase family protein [Candidatus Phytoplasma stylosanthis]